MTVRPTLFAAPMVRAILREIEKPGTGKTQTRRVLNPQPAEWKAQVIDITTPTFDEDEGGWGQWVTEWSEPCPEMPMGEPNREIWRPLRGLRFATGDVLWVRETFAPWANSAGLSGTDFRATPKCNVIDRGWKPAIHMPRNASRLTLVVTDVRVERLQDITEADAIAEGVDAVSMADVPRQAAWSRRQDFSRLWLSINGSGSWDKNPWIVAVTFVPHAMNVDAFLAQKEAA